MTSQAGKNVRFALKAQSAKGTLASGAGAREILCRPSQGMRVQFAQAISQLVAPDGMSRKPRQGSRFVPGNYETEIVVDALDEIVEAVQRGTWTAEATITEATASLTSLAISNSGATLTAGGGSWITAGIRKGMMIKLASMSTAANNGKWVPVLAVTATVITTQSGILTDQGADSDFDMIIARYVIPTEPPAERYFTAEQYLQDIDTSFVGQDCKICAIDINITPNEPAMMGFDITGIDADLLATGSSPTFSSPTRATGRPLYLVDGGLYLGGSRIVNITGLRLRLAMSPSTLAVAGSRLSPDVFLDNQIISGEVSGSIEDDTLFNYALNETQLAVLLHLAERESDPADFVSFFFGDLGLGDFGLPFAQSGAMIQTFPIVGGKDEGGATSGFAPAIMLASTSAT